MHLNAIQVSEHMLDEEWAHLRGIVIPQDDILWPTLEEFELEKVSRRINDYISQSWKLDPKWMYYVHPIQTICDELKKRYIFEVI